jgi:hypothetical protein
MNQERLRVLELLSQGKIDVREAATLLEALGERPPAAPAPGSGSPAASGARTGGPRYLRVLVEGDQGPDRAKVNVRVPLALVRAGVRLAALLPPGVHDQINKALKDQGVDLDVSKIRPEHLEELVEHLGDLTVDVDNEREKVRVFCE